MFPARNRIFAILSGLLWLCAGCLTRSNVDVAFQALDSARTGLSFANKLTPSDQFNALKYMYFFNGAGIGAADFNNDGKIDLFFASNQRDNKMYLNAGGLKFKDVTREAEIPSDGGWSTGVSVVDINNDGLMDIYICRVGDYQTLHSKNELLICQGIDKNGIPHYKDEARQYGLDFSGFSTQAVFFDYDGDGYLDMFLLNHSVFENGTVGDRSMLLEKEVPASGDRVYHNDGNGHFSDATKASGINCSVLDYGLGVCASDIDLDGYPDLYVGNDFHENDYLYINQRNGKFKESLRSHMMHTSKYTMGVDVADANNDGYPDVISMDMLASDPTILKRSMGDDNQDLFNLKLSLGYYFQYPRNNLQMNRGNGMFSEIGLYSGIAATDWSWSPLWVDFNNDGLKDLFVSNGIPRRLNDIDYINFVSNSEIQQRLQQGHLEKGDVDVLNSFPEIKIPNKFFLNKGEMRFADLSAHITDNKPTFSNGAVFADFDNDGDLDVVVNNIDEGALLYENKTNKEGDSSKKKFIEIRLRGSQKNINAVGAKIVLFCQGKMRLYENFPVKGFMSSMQIPIHIGLANTKIDSSIVIWPDNTFVHFNCEPPDSWLTLTYQSGLPQFDYSVLANFNKNPTFPAEDISKSVGLTYVHEENHFQEFSQEPLLPHMLSTEGPALAVGDVNNDGLQDVFIGGAKNKQAAFYVQRPGQKFQRMNEPALAADSAYEDVSACFADINGDGYQDLIVVSGGNEVAVSNEQLRPRIYLNNGSGMFEKAIYLDAYATNASCVVPLDINNDGRIDLFIGSRSVPGKYGEIPRSFLLINKGNLAFDDAAETSAPGLAKAGLVTSAIACDINHDGEKDLIITMEWGGIVAFMNHNGRFEKRMLTDKKGWWNFVLPIDINNDGHVDFIAGNLGLNSRFDASKEHPLRMYYNDFDDNGTKEQIVTYYVNGKEIPFASFMDLQKQIPSIKKKFLYAGDFAKASLEQIFSKEKLASSKVFTANYFANALLLNDGNSNFTIKALPWKAQLSSYRTAAVVDANGDGRPDVLLGGNYYGNNVQMGRNDADFGTVLLNHGIDSLSAESLNGLVIKGEVRHIEPIRIGNVSAFVLARNNDTTAVLRFKNHLTLLSKK